MKTISRTLVLSSTFLVLLFTLASCAHMEKIDSAYTSKDPSFQKSYAKNQQQCLAATVKAVKDMGAGIDEQKGLELSTTKWVAHESAEGSGSGGYYVATYNKQEAKLYVKVSGTQKNCNVAVTRVRAWNNNVEYEKLNLAFTKARVVEPFFKNLEERMN